MAARSWLCFCASSDDKIANLDTKVKSRLILSFLSGSDDRFGSGPCDTKVKR